MKQKYRIESKYSDITDFLGNLRSNGLYNKICDKVRGEIEICLVEALNNVVRHSYKEKEDNVIDLELTSTNDSFEIIITEYGLARPKLSKPELNFDPEDIENLPEGGMGLFLIDQIMDFTEYNSVNGTNSFKMIKNLS
ncbi:MAG: ATP-binding protein [Bacteroidetes bacterium]|nr:ATP-binding protein [Bacteroidota bacterium]